MGAMIFLVLLLVTVAAVIYNIFRKRCGQITKSLAQDDVNQLLQQVQFQLLDNPKVQGNGDIKDCLLYLLKPNSESETFQVKQPSWYSTLSYQYSCQMANMQLRATATRGNRYLCISVKPQGQEKWYSICSIKRENLVIGKKKFKIEIGSKQIAELHLGVSDMDSDNLTVDYLRDRAAIEKIIKVNTKEDGVDKSKAQNAIAMLPAKNYTSEALAGLTLAQSVQSSRSDTMMDTTAHPDDREALTVQRKYGASEMQQFQIKKFPPLLGFCLSAVFWHYRSSR